MLHGAGFFEEPHLFSMFFFVSFRFILRSYIQNRVKHPQLLHSLDVRGGTGVSPNLQQNTQTQYPRHWEKPGINMTQATTTTVLKIQHQQT